MVPTVSYDDVEPVAPDTEAWFPASEVDILKSLLPVYIMI